MLGIFTGTPAAAVVTNTRRDGSVIHLVMAVVCPGAVLTWFGDDN